MHEACTWAAIAVLIYMVLVLFVSLVWLDGVKKRVYIPVSPDTIAGCMYYLYESRMLEDFHQEMALLGARERDKLVCEMGRLCGYGEMKSDIAGGFGAKRVGVDYCPFSFVEGGLPDVPRAVGEDTGAC